MRRSERTLVFRFAPPRHLRIPFPPESIVDQPRPHAPTRRIKHSKTGPKGNGMRGLNASTAAASTSSSSTAPMFHHRPSPVVAAARCSCSCGAQPAASARPSQRPLGGAVRAVSAAAASSSGGSSSSNASRSASSFGGQGLPSSRRQKHNQSSSSRLFSHVVRASQDYYEVLGVKRDADKKAIKQAYRYDVV